MTAKLTIRNMPIVPEKGMHAIVKRKLSLIQFTQSLFFRVIICLCLAARCDATLGQDKKAENTKPEISKADTTKNADDTYGKGGTKLKITHTVTRGENDVDEYEDIVFLDPKGQERERRTIVQFKGAGLKAEESTTIFGANTKVTTYYKEIKKDETGTTVSFTEQRYKDERDPSPNTLHNIQIYGFSWDLDDKGIKKARKYNPKTKAYEDVDNTSLPEDNQASAQPLTGNSNLFYHPNEVFLGPAYMNIANSGQGNSGYGSLGVTGEYTRLFTPHFGATLDVGAYYHKQTQNDFTQSYTQLNITAGPTFIPFKNPASEDKKLSGNLHALAGLSSITIKESSGSYGIDKISKQGLTLAVGGALNYWISNNIGVRVQADYTPTFFFKTMQNNIRVGAGVVIGLGSEKTPIPEYGGIVDSTQEKTECKASGITTELKISLYAIEKAAKLIEAILKKLPRVKDPKVSVSPMLTVKRGEACCSKDEPPVAYTELKGGVEGTVDLNFNLWGMPDIDYEVNLWTVLLKVVVECKIYGKINGKINLTGVGKFFGELGQTDRPDCKACYYLDFKMEIFGGLGAKIKGAVDVYFWSPLNRGEGGFDKEGKPDEEVEVSAEASATIGCTADGTYASGDCKKPPAGLTGQLVLGKAKFNFKIKVELGPLSFHPSLEIPLLDGIKIDF